MNALLITGPAVYGLVVFFVWCVCSAAKRGDDMSHWRN
jgi:hypothetical protein